MTEIFAGAKKEEKAEGQDLGSCQRCGGLLLLMSEGGHLCQQRGWKRFDAGRRRIGVGPRAIKGDQPEIDLVAATVHPRVRGPQCGVRLAHTAKGVLHRARLDAPPAGGQGTGAEPLGEDLEEGAGSVGRLLVLAPSVSQKADQRVQALEVDVLCLGETRDRVAS